MLKLDRARMLEAEHLATLRVHTGHYVADGAVFTGGIHGLKNQQDGVAVAGVMQPLQAAQLFDMFVQQCFVILLGSANRLALCRPFVEIDIGALMHPVFG